MNDKASNDSIQDDRVAVINIPITQGYVAIVDSVDADLADLNWQAVLKLRNRYAIHSSRKGTFYLHRVILSRMMGRDLTRMEQCDHIDGDGLNNRRENLRIATNAQNRHNSRKSLNSTSKLKGVCFHKQRQKWQASIRINGKQKHLGLFDTEELAHEAYCEAAEKYFGEFARFE